MGADDNRPPAVFWFKVYAACLAAIYALVFLGGIALLAFAHRFDEPVLPILGGVYIVLGLIFLVGFLLTFAFKPSPFAWIYDLVLICIGLSGCPTLAASIPLLLYWLKPEVKRYYGKLEAGGAAASIRSADPKPSA